MVLIILYRLRVNIPNARIFHEYRKIKLHSKQKMTHILKINIVLKT